MNAIVVRPYELFSAAHCWFQTCVSVYQSSCPCMTWEMPNVFLLLMIHNLDDTPHQCADRSQKMQVPASPQLYSQMRV